MLKDLDLDLRTKTMLFLKYFKDCDKPIVNIGGKSFYCWEGWVGEWDCIESSNVQWIIAFVENNGLKEDFKMVIRGRWNSVLMFSMYLKDPEFWNVYFKLRRQRKIDPKRKIHEELEYINLDFTI
jgi:hypothetical protein